MTDYGIQVLLTEIGVIVTLTADGVRAYYAERRR